MCCDAVLLLLLSPCDDGNMQTSRHRTREKLGVLSLISRVTEMSIIVQIIFVNVHTVCNVDALLVDAKQYLAVLVVQSLAINTAQIINERLESDVLAS